MNSNPISPVEDEQGSGNIPPVAGVDSMNQVRLPWRIFGVLICLPALWAAFLVFQFGVNCPHFDQWIGMAPVFESMEAGKLGWHDFVIQHNEHRLPLPRLIFFAVDIATHWNTRVEMCLTVLTLVATAAAFWKLLEATGWKANSTTYTVFATMGLLVLDPLQVENLVEGFQFHFILPLALLVTALWAAIALRQPANYIVTAVLATAATFSMAVGLSAWILVFPLLLLRGRNAGWRKWTAIWGGVFAANLVLFFCGYQKPETTIGALLQQPGKALHYFLVFFGSPFSWGPTANRVPIAASAGALILAGIASACGLLWLWRKDIALIRRSLPWVMVSGIGLVHGAMVTLGRFHFGAAQALESRYVPYAVAVPVGLLALSGLAVEQSLRQNRRWPALLFVAGSMALLCLYAFAIVDDFDRWQSYNHWNRMCKGLVQAIDFLDPSYERLISPKPERLRTTIHALDRLGYLHPPILKSREIKAISEPAPSSGAHFGAIEKSSQKSDLIAVSGWALLPGRPQSADDVLLTYDDPNGDSIIFAVSAVFFPRADIAAATGDPNTTYCGWREVVSTSQLPPGASKITAWAYDAEKRHAWRLDGSAAGVR